MGKHDKPAQQPQPQPQPTPEPAASDGNHPGVSGAGKGEHKKK